MVINVEMRVLTNYTTNLEKTRHCWSGMIEFSISSDI